MSVAVSREIITLKSIAKSFGTEKKEESVLKDISFSVHENEFLVLLGPGQCGKTTILNIIADLETADRGEIVFTDGKPAMGDLGFVFQKYALFPWKTVMGNVAVGEKLKGIPKAVRRSNAQKYIDMVGLQGFENAFPMQLSGGMKQRVGIARAYATQADILLMDEPFGALDAQTRYQMENELVNICETNQKTIIFVTNNVEEAIYLGERILLLSAKPSTVKTEFVVDLPRPRNTMDKDFLKLRNDIVAQMDISI